jgi:hypothetical protein
MRRVCALTRALLRIARPLDPAWNLYLDVLPQVFLGHYLLWIGLSAWGRVFARCWADLQGAKAICHWADYSA